MLLFALAGLSCRSEPHRISSCAALKTAPAHDVDCPKSSSPWDQHPWDFKRPGRYTDLPAESVFAGFDGLDALLEDDFDDFDLAIPDSEGASSSGEYCKVRPHFSATRRSVNFYRTSASSCLPVKAVYLRMACACCSRVGASQSHLLIIYNHSTLMQQLSNFD